MNPRRLLVTGGAGFIGSHLVDALLDRGDHVRVLDNLDPQAHEGGVARFVSPGAELLNGDLRDPGAVDQALEGVDAVFHQGGLVGNGQSMYEIARYIEANSVGTAVLLEGVVRRRDRVRRLVVASSMVVYGDGAYRCPEHGQVVPGRREPADLASGLWEPRCPTCRAFVTPAPTPESSPLSPASPYGISKRDTEELALVTGRSQGIEVVALRYLNVYGPRQALSNPYTGVAAVFCTRLLSGLAPLVFEDGRQRRDLIHISDVVRANLAALDAPDAPGHAINVGTGVSITVADLALSLARELGLEIAPDISGRHRAGDIRHCWADTTLATRLLGFTATAGRGRELSALAAWVRTQRPVDRTEAATAELIARGLIR